MPSNDTRQERRGGKATLPRWLKTAVIALAAVMLVLAAIYLFGPWETLYYNGCEKGNRAHLKVALLVRPDLANKAFWMETPLGKATSNGYEDEVRLMLDCGANPNAPGLSGWTAVHVAAALRETRILRLLLERGGDPNARTNGGMTALHTAAWSGQTESIPILLEHGGHRDAKDNQDKTALDIAKDRGHGETARMLTPSAGEQ